MKFSELVANVADEPVFETGLLLAGNRDAANVHRQLSRWVAAGRLRQLRRGLYALPPPFQKVAPHPFVIANHLARGSYVSLQAALGYYSLIPEGVPVVTSVGTGRTQDWDTPLGRFELRHISHSMLRGYRSVSVDGQRKAYVASPEKALLDLVYLVPGGDHRDYLEGLRLQNLDRLDLPALATLAGGLGKPKLVRAADHIRELAEAELAEYEAL